MWNPVKTSKWNLAGKIPLISITRITDTDPQHFWAVFSPPQKKLQNELSKAVLAAKNYTEHATSCTFPFM